MTNAALAFGLYGISLIYPIRPSEVFVTASTGTFIVILMSNYPTFTVRYLAAYAAIWALAGVGAFVLLRVI